MLIGLLIANKCQKLKARSRNCSSARLACGLRHVDPAPRLRAQLAKFGKLYSLRRRREAPRERRGLDHMADELRPLHLERIVIDTRVRNFVPVIEVASWRSLGIPGNLVDSRFESLQNIKTPAQADRQAFFETMQTHPQAMAEPELPDLPSFDTGARARSSADDFPRLALPADFDATGLALECAGHAPYAPTSGVRYRTLPLCPSASERDEGPRCLRTPSGRTYAVTRVRRLTFTLLRSAVWRAQLRVLPPRCGIR